MTASLQTSTGLGAAAVAVAALLTGAASPAQGDVLFNQDTIIASGAQVSDGNVMIDISAPGQVDVAWQTTNDNQTMIYYSQTNASGGLTVDAQAVLGTGEVGNIMGISRDSGTVRIGASVARDVIEYTRGPGGAWTASGTGVNSQTVIAPIGGYDVNPTNGLGGFAFQKQDGGFVYVHETSPGVWSEQALSGDTGVSPWADFVYSGTGSPIVAYKADFNGAATGGNELHAGVIGQSVTNVASASANLHAALAVDGDGNIHLLDAAATNRMDYYLSTDGGQSWSSRNQVSDRAFATSQKDYNIAVDPVHGTLAVLGVRDRTVNNQWTLFISEDSGTTWTDQVLGGAQAQIADVDFDSLGNLYVAYYDAGDGKLHLMTTYIPEPGSLTLMGLGGLALLGRKRRKDVRA